jgi:ubiquinone/menaquinone biosynthesis C-methylase UbiE
MLKAIAKQIVPPVLWSTMSYLKNGSRRNEPYVRSRSATGPEQQDLDIYWTPAGLQAMEVWGEGTAWTEIQYLLVGLKGKVLDIACGTGKPMQIMSVFPQLEVYGVDISDFFIRKAVERGISPERLRVGDATRLDYADDSFDYSYSIGSLEHFTEKGIARFVAECYRVTRSVSFHQIPVSLSGTNEGWLKTTMQSYYNNSIPWWLEKFRQKYNTVHVLDSRWEDHPRSLSKWFVCVKEYGN